MLIDVAVFGSQPGIFIDVIEGASTCVGTQKTSQWGCMLEL
jgi:hypothetical protein